jgi:hypothetical protein
MLFEIPSYAAGWKEDARGWWYQYENGSYASSAIKNINGENYAFNGEGYMLTGWQYLSFKWYYFDPAAGNQVIGWKQINGVWYYLDPQNSGSMYVYWLERDGKRYYLDENGALKTGLFFLSNDIEGSKYAYQADENGILIRNTKKKNGDKMIWYDENGIMRYLNDKTKQVGNATEGAKWQYILSEQDMLDQKDENDQIIKTEIRRMQNELYDEYVSKVLSAKTSKKAEKQSAGESKAEKKLKLYQADQEIMDYISLVLNGSYVKVSEQQEPYGSEEEYLEEDYDNVDYFSDEEY